MNTFIFYHNPPGFGGLFVQKLADQRCHQRGGLGEIAVAAEFHRAVAAAVFARYEEHDRRQHLADFERIVAGAAGQTLVGVAPCLAVVFEHVQHVFVEGDRFDDELRVHVVGRTDGLGFAVKGSADPAGDVVDVVTDTETSTILSAEMPVKTILTVTHSEPGVKGNTATNATKPATLETGVEIRVPLFINEGETIQVDTRDGSYLGRVNSDK